MANKVDELLTQFDRTETSNPFKFYTDKLAATFWITEKVLLQAQKVYFDWWGYTWWLLHELFLLEKEERPKWKKNI